MLGEYMEAINVCPHHGFDTWLLVSYFYDGMSSSMKQLLKMMCGGDFMSKNPKETMDFLSYVAEVSRGWDEPNAREVGRMDSHPMLLMLRLGYLKAYQSHIVQEKEKFTSQPHQTPRVSMKWRLMRRIFSDEGSQSMITLRSGKEVDLPISKPEQEPENEAEKEKSEEIKGKRKGNSTKKKDLEAKGINNASEILEVLRNGVMQLTFGNMTLELNIFYMCNKLFHPGEEEGLEEVCMIDNLVEEHCDQKMLEYLNESFGDLDEGLPEPLDLLATLPPLKMREEILSLFNKEETQEAVKEKPPKLILKPLPTELKYAYLEENKRSPIVISSSFTTTQKDLLLEILRRCKKAIGVENF
ncbi:hypothetical protein CK203_075489 [Vitis vinifera]|uniref:Uncharacterized protein n=1 Tax=Vitis vinifera TaxID=29760 RepID=A0A438EU96_VITVI|nr:hypothetical protein CK203_075489 [Vitis vinifera]